MIKEKKSRQFTVNEVCIELKLNKNTRDYMNHKFNDNFYSLDEWKQKLKKDGILV